MIILSQVVTDQSALICTGGVLISLIFAIVTNLLQHFFEIRLLTRNTIELLASGLCAGYWIYMSEKLRDVLRKWLRI